MYCPTCQVVLAEVAEACPTCGESLRPVALTDAVRSVEGSARTEAVVASVATAPAPGEANTPGASLLPAIRERPETRVLARLPRLTVVAWSQPKVRAAMKTGASALALTLAMRAAGRMLTDRRSRGGASRAVGSLLGEALRPTRPTRASDSASHGEMVEILETYISVRTVRRVARR